MSSPRSSRSGFTLLEIVVVLAVVGALLAALAPAAFSYYRDAQLAQAQHDANQIAAAIGNFLRSTALPPYKNTTSADKIPKKEAADFVCLYGSVGQAYSAVDDATAGDSWSSCFAASSTRDTFANHLITNTPGGSGTKAYKTTGRNAWEGPYLPAVSSDPWGKPYLVNVGQMDPGASTPKAAWVISGGPNGTLETAFDQNAGVAISPGGDDLIARVK